MKRCLVSFLRLVVLFPLLYMPAQATVIFENSESPVGNEKVFIKKVEVLEEKTDSIKVKTTYIVFPDIGGDVNFWISPDHTESIFYWDAVQAWTGYNADVIEIKLLPEQMAAQEQTHTESSVLKLSINLSEEEPYEFEIDYSKIWSIE